MIWCVYILRNDFIASVFRSLANNNIKALPRDLFLDLDSLIELCVTSPNRITLHRYFFHGFFFFWLSFVILKDNEMNNERYALLLQGPSRQCLWVWLPCQVVDDVAEEHQRHSVRCHVCRTRGNEGQTPQWHDQFAQWMHLNGWCQWELIFCLCEMLLWLFFNLLFCFVLFFFCRLCPPSDCGVWIPVHRHV